MLPHYIMGRFSKIGKKKIASDASWQIFIWEGILNFLDVGPGPTPPTADHFIILQFDKSP